MPSLPIELYRLIVESITDKPTLYSLLFASSIFNDEAERVLYRKVSPKGKESQEMLFHRLSSSKRVAELVLDLDLDIHAEEFKADSLSYWSSFSRALCRLINLKAIYIWYLGLNLSGFASKHGLDRLFDGCLFQLEIFSWPFPLKEQLLTFLENQRQIQRLSLFHRLPTNAVSSNALPRLSILTGTTPVITALLPGRQVTHLSWTRDIFSNDPELARIGPALNNIRVLNYDEIFRPSQLRAIISCLGKLEVLKWERETHQDLLDNASLFSHLREIIFPYTPYMSSVFTKSTERLFASIPTLLLVDSRVDEGAFRWSRGSDRPVPIVMNDR